MHKSDDEAMEEDKKVKERPDELPKEGEPAASKSHGSKDSHEVIAQSIEEVKRPEEVDEPKNEREQPHHFTTLEIRDNVTQNEKEQLDRENMSRYRIARLVVSIAGFVIGALACFLAVQFGYVDNGSGNLNSSIIESEYHHDFDNKKPEPAYEDVQSHEVMIKAGTESVELQTKP
jgi:hypothetical protein